MKLSLSSGLEGQIRVTAVRCGWMGVVQVDVVQVGVVQVGVVQLGVSTYITILTE